MKAETQERGTERGMEHGTEIIWFHTGNYIEMMQEVTINRVRLITSHLAIIQHPTDLAVAPEPAN